MTGFDLQSLARPNILKLEPYRCARDDYKEGVLLDANENTHGPSLVDLTQLEAQLELNRYPDPHQLELKQLIANFRNSESRHKEVAPLSPENLFVGVGSDEAIDAVIRILCIPGKSKLLTCPPTYGMYSVSADINNVEVVKCDQEFTKGNFSIRADAVIDKLAQDQDINLVYFCSPGNPTASLLNVNDITKVLEFQGANFMVVVDEAYIDFAPEGSSWAPLVNKYPNLIVMQTLSKSFGLAGIRCGMCFSDPKFAALMNAMKAPYNLPTPSSDLAKRALSKQGISLMRDYVAKMIAQRERLVQELPKIPGMGEFVGGQDANFVLIEVLDKPGGTPSNDVALRVYMRLAQQHSVVVRFRGKEPGCMGCIRISTGTDEETTILLKELTAALESVYASQ